MIFTLDQQKGAYRRLPENVRDFVMSNDTTDMVSEALSKAGLAEDVAIQADSEILHAMTGLQTLGQAIENISAISGKPLGELTGLRSELEDKIFNQLKKMMPSGGEKISTNIEIEKAQDMPATPESAAGMAPRASLLDEIEHPKPTPERAIEPPKPELKLDAPKPNESPVSLAPSTQAIKPRSLISEKLAQVVTNAPRNTSYPDGKDPYREPTV